MKTHTPIFIIGLLVFVTPILGLPQIYEQIILGAYGLAIMIIISTNSLTNKIKIHKDFLPGQKDSFETLNNDKEESTQ